MREREKRNGRVRAFSQGVFGNGEKGKMRLLAANAPGGGCFISHVNRRFCFSEPRKRAGKLRQGEPTRTPRTDEKGAARPNNTMNKLKVYIPIAIVALIVVAVVFRVPALRKSVAGFAQ
jgi:hypothetical protein